MHLVSARLCVLAAKDGHLLRVCGLQVLEDARRVRDGHAAVAQRRELQRQPCKVSVTTSRPGTALSMSRTVTQIRPSTAAPRPTVRQCCTWQHIQHGRHGRAQRRPDRQLSIRRGACLALRCVFAVQQVAVAALKLESRHAQRHLDLAAERRRRHEAAAGARERDQHELVCGVALGGLWSSVLRAPRAENLRSAPADRVECRCSAAYEATNEVCTHAGLCSPCCSICHLRFVHNSSASSQTLCRSWQGSQADYSIYQSSRLVASCSSKAAPMRAAAKLDTASDRLPEDEALSCHSLLSDVEH
jgi:hypothetical protein